MRLIRVVTVAATLLVLGAVIPLAAQSGRLRGRVTDSAGAGLSGAVVIVEGTPLRAVAGAQGAYDLRGIPSGTHTVRVRLIGFLPGSAQISIPAGGETQHVFVLVPSPVQLAPINVVTGSRARHTAAEELAVPVDVFGSESIKQVGSTETGEVLARRGEPAHSMYFVGCWRGCPPRSTFRARAWPTRATS